MITFLEVRDFEKMVSGIDFMQFKKIYFKKDYIANMKDPVISTIALANTNEAVVQTFMIKIKYYKGQEQLDNIKNLTMRIDLFRKYIEVPKELFYSQI